VPKDSSAQFAHKLPQTVDWADPDDITLQYQGGVFLLNGPKYKAGNEA
jgi:uronate dehydrogenase